MYLGAPSSAGELASEVKLSVNHMLSLAIPKKTLKETDSTPTAVRISASSSALGYRNGPGLRHIS